MREHFDNMGRDIRATYSTILTDPYFEQRLKAFDPRLRLMFDQTTKRWMVLEWAYDNSGWNIVIVAEDENKNPKPLGEWVFNKLFVMRCRNDEHRRMGTDTWIEDIKKAAEVQREEIEHRNSVNDRDRIRDDIIQWRKAAKEFDGLPVSDATAGYPKN